MCKSQAEGGARCATHTRPGYDGLVKQIDAVGDGFGAAQAREKVRRDYRHGDANPLNVVADHASTPSGSKQVLKDIDRYTGAGDVKMVAFLKSAHKVGRGRADAAKEAVKEIQHAAAKARNWMYPMKQIDDLPYEESALARCPRLAGVWDLEKNKGIPPHLVSKAANCETHWTCRNGHQNVLRLNNITSTLNRGGMMKCDECRGQREIELAQTQKTLTSLADVLDNPDDFASLSPATQYSIMSELGLLRGDASVQSDVALNIVHGDLTLKDVIAARGINRLDDQLQELSDTQTLSALDDMDAAPRRTQPPTVDEILSTSAAAGLVDQTLADHIARENVNALWEQAYTANNSGDLDEFAAQVAAGADRSSGAARVAQTFADELHATRNWTPPDGFNPDQIDKVTGLPKRLDPTLAQARFVLMAAEKERILDASGTGAGKTLASALAVHAVDARETVVICPNSVTGQWSSTFAQSFGEKVEIREGLPTGNEPPPPEGVNRVWVANYEKFQGDSDDIAARTDALAGRVDAIVFDEIHMAKVTDENSTSRRRAAIQQFRDTAGERNPSLMVIGASATPVVNNLAEADSILRLVEGSSHAPMETTPNIKNAVAAHHRLTAAGIRHKPDYPTTLTNEPTVIDISDRVGAVKARLDTYVADSNSGQITPAMMERALLPEKIPALIKAVRAAEGPSLVYSEYTAGMVEPMRKALSDSGLRVATYTGTETADERAETLRQFRDLRYDVLIGSRPLATGVDGLQSVSNNLIVVSPPWTAACDDQLKGRLQRRGQTRDVRATFLRAEASVGDMSWSWDRDHRESRIEHKRTLADAAVDGIIPDGTMEREANAAHAFKALADLLPQRTPATV